MSLNPLKIATAGYLKRTTKAVLIIAVAGYLNFGGTPPTPSHIGDDGGAGISQQLPHVQRLDRAWYYDEEDILTIIKIWTKING